MGFILPIAALVAGAAGAFAAPTGLAALGIGATALGGVVSAVGGIESANAQKKAAEYQSQVAQNNAQLASQQANQTMAAGDQAAANEGLKARAQVGAIKAAQGASNVDVNTGSALDTRASAAELGELNAMTVRSNASKQAYGYQTNATSDLAQAGLYKMQAQQAPTAGLLNASGSLLSSASGVANQYQRWSLAGGGFGGSNTGGGGGATGGNDVIF
jgi:hypothetical protein